MQMPDALYATRGHAWPHLMPDFVLQAANAAHTRSACHATSPRFGFNVGMGMVDGLWVGGSEAATDFALIAYQIRLLGYNAVRLPFIWRDLEMAPKPLDKDCSPVAPEVLKRRLISPHVVDKYMSKALPGNVAPQKKRSAGYCNQYLPNRSGFHRLLFTLQSFIGQGMYVILDYQPMVGGGWVDGLSVGWLVGGWVAGRLVAVLVGGRAS